MNLVVYLVVDCACEPARLFSGPHATVAAASLSRRTAQYEALALSGRLDTTELVIVLHTLTVKEIL